MATKITVTWQANLPVDQVTSYELWESRNGATYASLGSQGLSLSKEILNPLPGTYSYKVKALNIVGTSALSAAGDGPQAVPATPEAPVVTVTVS